MSKFAKMHQLELDEFAEMQSQYDEKHGLLVEQTANQFNLDRSNFALARQDLEAKHTGQWQFSGTITAEDLGFSTEAWGGMDNDEKVEYAKALVETYKTLQGEELTGGVQRAIDMLQGINPVSVEAAWTQDARESARRYGLDERQFIEANDQFNRSFEESNQQAWTQIVGYSKDDAGKTRFTQGYRAWKTAQADLEKVQRRRDASWEAVAQNALGPQSGQRANPVWDLRAAMYEGRNDKMRGVPRNQLIDEAVNLWEERYGYPPERAAVAKLFSSHFAGTMQDSAGINIQSWSSDKTKIAELSNAINGHALDVTQAMSGWQVAGQVFGQALNVGATIAAAGSDPGLKQNVVHVGRSSSGLNVYEFDYKPGLGPTGRYRGVMSNEIPQNAVIHRAIYDKYDAVDYSKIDVDFEKLI